MSRPKRRWRRHVGEIGLGDRMVGKRAVAELAGGSESDGLFERAACEAERGGADGDAEQVQSLHGDFEAIALGAEQLAADAVELQPGQRVRRDDLDTLGDRQDRDRRRER